ncbi:MAG: hypothetical protein ABJG15_08195 [Hyphomonadaceae bacterium]
MPDDTKFPFTVLEGGRKNAPAETSLPARRSDEALGRWKKLSVRVTPRLSEFIERYVQSQPAGYLHSDILHDAMIALCEKRDLLIYWRTAREEGPLIMGYPHTEERCPEHVDD